MVVLLQTPIELSNYPLILGLAILVYAVLSIRFIRVYMALLSTLIFSILYLVVIKIGTI